MNVMRAIKIEKVTLNIGAGKDQNRLEKGILLIKALTGITPVKTTTSKRIPEWGLRPGLPIGCKLTIRGKKAAELLRRLLEAKDFQLSEKQFSDDGTVSFGIAEYIDVPGMKYDPKIGIMGFEACITLERNGFRIKRRVAMRRKIPKNHRITKQEAVEFMEKNFKIRTGESA